MTVTIKEVPILTPEEQATCEHDWNKAYVMFAGTVVEMCKKCKLRKNERPVTDKEADEVYDNF